MKSFKYTDEELKATVSQSNSIYDVIRLLGGSLTSGTLHRHISKRVQEAGIDRSHFKRPTDISSEKHKLLLNDVLTVDRRNGRRERSHVLRRVMIEYGFKEVCSVCGLEPAWNGKALRLEIDHIDMNPINNLPENLRFICPNCHSQCDTYKGVRKVKQVRIRKSKVSKPKGVKERKFNVSSEELARLVWEKPSIEIAQLFGVSDAAISKRCKTLNIKKPGRGYWAKLHSGSKDQW